VRIGIVSNTGWDISQGYAHAGLGGLIDTWVLSWQHGTAKPDPWLFAHACERLRVNPARALMVGNDAEADGGAAAVGATVLILPEVQPEEPRGLKAVLDLVGLAPTEQTGPGPPGTPNDPEHAAQLAV
jgi:putative hydrolase of the HAD superfamily